MQLAVVTAALLLVVKLASAGKPDEEARFSMVVMGKLGFSNGEDAAELAPCKEIKKLELLDKDGWHDEQACGKDPGKDAEIDIAKPDGPYKLDDHAGFHIAGVAWDPVDDEALLEPMISIQLKDNHNCKNPKLKFNKIPDTQLWTNKNLLRIAAPRKYSQLFTDWNVAHKSFKDGAADTFKDAKKIEAKKPEIKNWGTYKAEWVEGVRKQSTYNFGTINVNLIEFMNCKGSGCYIRKVQKCGHETPSNDWEAPVVKDEFQLEPFPGSAGKMPHDDVPTAGANP